MASYTTEEMQPFTTDPRSDMILNVFCKGQVRDTETDPRFLGWIIQGQRPLSVGKFTQDRVIVGYGAFGTLIPTYQQALDIIYQTNEHPTFGRGLRREERQVKIFAIEKLRPLNE